MDTSTVTSINLNKICRICLVESQEMHSIFSVLQTEDEKEDLTYVYEILMNISSIKILTNQMPTTLCTTCLELANTSYKFQQQCNRSQVILETYLMQLDTNRENDKEEISITTPTENTASKDDVINLVDVKDIDIKANMALEEVNDSFNEELDDLKLKVETEQGCNPTKIKTLKNKLKPKLIVKQSQTIDGRKSNKLAKQSLNYCVKTTEHGSKVYACNLCDKSYKYGSSLKVHTRSHTLERPYVCKVCGKNFKQYGSLTYHLRSHSGEQPYTCHLCGKKYKQSGSLKTHMRVHTGQRPFLCSICGRGFRQAPDLGYHMRTHTKEKPYMCNICGKTMSMQCHLVQHMRTHTGERPFKCTQCDKAFPSTTRLKRHAIIHTGLKPYKCEVCDRSFNRQSSLRVHAKIHTDDRPHVCSVCGKGFIQPHSLKCHLMTHYSSTSEIKVT